MGISLDGSLLVADSLGFRVQRFPRGAARGDVPSARTIAGGCGSGPALWQLGQPMAVMEVEQGIVVSDPDNSRILLFPSVPPDHTDTAPPIQQPYGTMRVSVNPLSQCGEG
mmetsp:Transcript_29071/g.68527  ORF Transcript_29071/g.68527 Transcript_29071/m.68527 type:complete len:111 (+) Transcript_29071:169-501(+)